MRRLHNEGGCSLQLLSEFTEISTIENGLTTNLGNSLASEMFFITTHKSNRSGVFTRSVPLVQI